MHEVCDHIVSSYRSEHKKTPPKHWMTARCEMCIVAAVDGHLLFRCEQQAKYRYVSLSAVTIRLTLSEKSFFSRRRSSSRSLCTPRRGYWLPPWTVLSSFSRHPKSWPSTSKLGRRSLHWRNSSSENLKIIYIWRILHTFGSLHI